MIHLAYHTNHPKWRFDFLSRGRGIRANASAHDLGAPDDPFRRFRVAVAYGGMSPLPTIPSRRNASPSDDSEPPSCKTSAHPRGRAGRSRSRCRSKPARADCGGRTRTPSADSHTGPNPVPERSQPVLEIGRSVRRARIEVCRTQHLVTVHEGRIAVPCQQSFHRHALSPHALDVKSRRLWDARSACKILQTP